MSRRATRERLKNDPLPVYCLASQVAHPGPGPCQAPLNGQLPRVIQMERNDEVLSLQVFRRVILYRATYRTAIRYAW